jgi:hypothetical protein
MAAKKGTAKKTARKGGKATKRDTAPKVARKKATKKRASDAG